MKKTITVMAATMTAMAMAVTAQAKDQKIEAQPVALYLMEPTAEFQDADLKSRHDSWNGAGVYLGQEATEDVLFAGSPAGMLFAVYAKSGTAQWAVTLDTSAPSTIYSPVRSDGVVFAGFTEFTIRL